MATLLQLVNPPNRKQYLDKSHYKSIGEQREAVAKSSTLYVGNLSFFTTEEQLYELFTKVGTVERIVMGLHRVEKTPCGFCFVEFRTRKAAVDAERHLNSVTMDGRVIKVEMDPGFKEGRQFGRARSGGQVRDEIRLTYDAARGGYGALVENEASAPGGPSTPFRPSGMAMGGPSGGGSPHFAIGGPSVGHLDGSGRRNRGNRRYSDGGDRNYNSRSFRDDGYHNRRFRGGEGGYNRRHSDRYGKRRRRHDDEFEHERDNNFGGHKRARHSDHGGAHWQGSAIAPSSTVGVDEFGRDSSRRQNRNPRFREHEEE